MAGSPEAILQHEDYMHSQRIVKQRDEPSRHSWSQHTNQALSASESLLHSQKDRCLPYLSYCYLDFLLEATECSPSFHDSEGEKTSEDLIHQTNTV